VNNCYRFDVTQMTNFYQMKKPFRAIVPNRKFWFSYCESYHLWHSSQYKNWNFYIVSVFKAPAYRV